MEILFWESQTSILCSILGYIIYSFPDNTRDYFAPNQIIQAIYDTVDDNGNNYKIISVIIDHRKNDLAVKLENSYITVNGHKKRKTTT